MKNKTVELLNQMSTIGYVDERLKILKDAYKGETVYIVASGPSLNNYPLNQLKEKLKDKLEFCIKQSYYNLKDVCDFQLVNFSNLGPYDFKEHTIVCWLYWFEQHLSAIKEQKWKADLVFPIIRNGEPQGLEHLTGKERFQKKLEQTVSHVGDWENTLFENNLARPWGPATMFELAIPLAEHLGCKKIVTLGWDIGDPTKYDDEKPESKRLDHFYQDEGTTLFDTVTIDKSELMQMVDGTLEYYKFLKTRGIDFSIISDTNPVSSEVPRMKFEDI